MCRFGLGFIEKFITKVILPGLYYFVYATVFVGKLRLSSIKLVRQTFLATLIVNGKSRIK